MNKFYSLILLILLSLPIGVWADNNKVTELEKELAEISLIDEKTTPKTIVEDKTDISKPISKRAIAKKFLLAMGGVTVSSVIIFIMLSLYNRIREKCAKTTYADNDAISLEPSNTLSDAIKVFLKKTNW